MIRLLLIAQLGSNCHNGYDLLERRSLLLNMQRQADGHEAWEEAIMISLTSDRRGSAARASVILLILALLSGCAMALQEEPDQERAQQRRQPTASDYQRGSHLRQHPGPYGAQSGACYPC